MKTPKVKARPVSIHSRTARRADDAAITKSEIKPVDLDDSIVSTRSEAHYGGIQKKKKAKQMTRQQRARHQKGLERADVVNEKMSKKVLDSAQSQRRIKDRAAAWDELNAKVPKLKQTAAPAKSEIENDNHVSDASQDSESSKTAPAVVDKVQEEEEEL